MEGKLTNFRQLQHAGVDPCTYSFGIQCPKARAYTENKLCFMYLTGHLEQLTRLSVQVHLLPKVAGSHEQPFMEDHVSVNTYSLLKLIPFEQLVDGGPNVVSTSPQ